MLKGWSEKLFVFCIAVTAVVEAGQQALKDAPALAALVPKVFRGNFWNYVPLVFLIAAGVIWLFGRLVPSARTTESVSDLRKAWRNPRLELVSGQTYINKTIEVDGKSFRDCIFENVTFMFHGTAPVDFVDTNRITGGFSIDTDHPVAMLYSKLQRFARAIPGARTVEGSIDDKGVLLPDHFRISPIIPEQSQALATVPVRLGESRPEIDGEVYRLVKSPRVMSWELFRDIHKVAGKGAEPLVDTDILVEMYLVNRHADKSRYIRDFWLSAEIGGKRVQFKRQDDLSTHDDKYDYGLHIEGAPPAKDAEPLKRLYQVLPMALAPEQPTEGWVRFMASAVNPELITDGTICLTVVDSVGKEYSIKRVSKERERRGEIGLRRVRD